MITTLHPRPGSHFYFWATTQNKVTSGKMEKSQEQKWHCIDLTIHLPPSPLTRLPKAIFKTLILLSCTQAQSNRGLLCHHISINCTMASCQHVYPSSHHPSSLSLPPPSSLTLTARLLWKFQVRYERLMGNTDIMYFIKGGSTKRGTAKDFCKARSQIEEFPLGDVATLWSNCRQSPEFWFVRLWRRH